MLHPLLLLLAFPAGAGDLAFGYPSHLGDGQKPALHVTPSRAVDILGIECMAGSETHSWERRGLPAGKTQVFEWARDTSVTTAECVVQVRFADDTAEGQVVALEYSYGDALAVDLSRASADVREHTLTVAVTARVSKAVVVAYGVGREVLEQREVPVDAGPGEITIPWAGDASDVVLLDVTVHGANAWASFTFSPWFLDVPHDDVHFDTDSDAIPADEIWKMEATLARLQEVVAKYGDLVPVKLYVAGCTDTVGDAAHNMDLSRRRARSIGRWLRQHGFDHPIYYHGFGEHLLAVETGDGVDSLANRRALYIVAANPPPAGSGVPAVSWTPL